jgi:2'-5' RNA ligase
MRERAFEEQAGGQSGEQIRTFVAIELPPDVLAWLGESQAGVTARAVRVGVGRGVKWASPSGVHLTLKFIGGTPPELVPEIERRLGAALAGRRRFALATAGLGVFPNLRAPRVIWVGLAGELPELTVVQRQVEEAIAPLGYPAEARGFSPHLTLARVQEWVGPADRQLLGEVVRGYSLPAPRRFEVAEVSLIRSELGRAGARYTRLLAVPLG